MVRETLVIQHDPDDDDNPQAFLRTHPVTTQIDAPSKAQSNGWGEVPKGRRR